MPRLADVAKAAGVATSTASRVLSDAPEAVHISDKVKNLVLAAAHDLEYYADPSARSLRTGKTYMVGLLGANLHPTHLGKMVQEAEHLFESAGYHLLTSTANLGSEEQEYSLNYFRKRLDGILIDHASWDRERGGAQLAIGRRHVPIVVLEGESGVDDISSVCLDDAAGGRMAAEHLLELGHRKIAYLSGPAENVSNRARLAALRHTAAEYPDTTIFVAEGTDQEACDDGYMNAKAMLARHPEITAMFCFNDMIAIGAISAIIEMGRSVPESVSLIGFDDEDWVAYTHPPLTTLHSPRAEIGREAAALLIEAIEHNSRRGADKFAPARKIVLKPELIIRKSTARVVLQR